jgi:hypothetical protein
MAFAKYDGPADPDSVWNWQVGMGGATITGQPIPAGGVAPLFTPRSVREALNRLSPPTPAKDKQEDNGDHQSQSNQGGTGDLILNGSQIQALTGGGGLPAASSGPVEAFTVLIAKRKGVDATGVYISNVTQPLRVTYQYGRNPEQKAWIGVGEPFFINLTSGVPGDKNYKDWRKTLRVSIVIDGETQVVYSPDSGLKKAGGDQ